jgi:uracil phosphoribosyltransferase
LEEAARSPWRDVYQLDLDKSRPGAFHDGVRVGSLEGLGDELSRGAVHSAVDLSRSSRAAGVLAAQTRRADLPPPDLQAVHEQVGRRLADKALDEYAYEDDLVEEEAFDHVQGTRFSGLVTRSRNVVILALMRGGEPMARGVFSRFPLARFVHYWGDDQPLEWGPSAEPRSVFVVDSVINRGDSVRRVLRRLGQAPLESSARTCCRG